MDEPIEEVYFNWLYSKVASITVPSTPSLTYLRLFRALYSTEFVWLISGDDNRLEEGLELRSTFLRESRLDQDPLWFSEPCSVLETLIAFAQVIEFETELTTKEWFWIMLENLNLAYLSDNQLGVGIVCEEILNTFIWRLYDENGFGGLFPIENPCEDQRNVEIYYQFCVYVVEHDII